MNHFKHKILLLAAAGVFASTVQADPPVQSMSVECNWGTLTMKAIQEDETYNQGQHSADPTGDGHGPGTADEPRKGLANVVSPGNLQATCEFIESLM